MGKENPLLWVSLWGKSRLGYGREQEVLEHVEGDWRHPWHVWSLSQVNFILTCSSAALGVLGIAGFPQ